MEQKRTFYGTTVAGRPALLRSDTKKGSARRLRLTRLTRRSDADAAPRPRLWERRLAVRRTIQTALMTGDPIGRMVH
ncbi:MAG TPA: hypothetical protein VM163_11225 [bacterium]|nr:hypothetical protein [bacterium]